MLTSQDPADDTNIKVTEMRDTINNELLGMLNKHFAYINQQFTKVTSDLGTVTEKIIQEVKTGTLTVEQQHELTRKELGGLLNSMEDNLRTTITRMRNSLARFIREEHASMTKELKDELRKNFGDLDDLILAVESQQEKNLTDLHGSLASLTKTVDKINIQTEKIPGLEQNQAQLMRLISTVGSQVSTANKALSRLQVGVGDIKLTLKNIAGQVKSTDEAVTGIDKHLQDALSKLQEVNKRVMSSDRRAKKRDRIINKCVAKTSSDIESLYNDLRRFWRGKKGAPMVTLAYLQKRFTDISGYIRRLETEMSKAGVDISSLKVHLDAYDEIIEGFFWSIG